MNRRKLQHTATSLSWQTVFFIGINFMIKFMGFILVPIYTHYLSAQNYGVLSIYDNVKIIFGFLASLYVEQAFIVHCKKKGINRNALFSGFFFLICGWNLFLVPAFSYSLFYFSILPKNSLRLIFIITASQLIWQLTSLFYSYWKSIFQSYKAALAEFFTYLLNVTFTLYFLIFFGWGWQSQIYATIIASSLQLIIVFGVFLKNRPYLFEWKIDFQPLLQGVKTGISMITPLSLFIVLGLLDRLILGQHVSSESVGLYNLAIKFLMVIIIVCETILKVFEPYLYQLMETAKSKAKITSTYTLYFLVVCVMLLALISFSRELIFFGVNKSYRGAYFYMLYFGPITALYALIRFQFSILIRYGNYFRNSLFILIFYLFHFLYGTALAESLSYPGVLIADLITMFCIFGFLKHNLKKYDSIQIRKPVLFSTIFILPLVYTCIIFIDANASPGLFAGLIKIGILALSFSFLAIHQEFRRLLSLFINREPGFV